MDKGECKLESNQEKLLGEVIESMTIKDVKGTNTVTVYKEEFDKVALDELKKYILHQFKEIQNGENVTLEDYFNSAIQTYIATALTMSLRETFDEIFLDDITFIENHFSDLINAEFNTSFPRYNSAYVNDFYIETMDNIVGFNSK